MKLEPIQNNQLSISLSRCELTRTSLEIAEGTDIHQWAEIGLSLRSMSDAALWWVGEWRNYAEANFEKDHKPAVDAFCEEKMASLGYSDETIRKAQYVSKRVDVGIRIPELSWGHHLFVAPKPPVEQRKWLKDAKANNWTIKQLRAAMREDGKEPSTEEINEDADEFKFERWINEAVRGFKSFPVTEWEDDVLTKRIQTLAEVQRPLWDEAEKRNLPVVERVKQAEAA